MLTKEIDFYKEQLFTYNNIDYNNYEKLQLLFDKLKAITRQSEYPKENERNLKNLNTTEKKVLNKVFEIIKENYTQKEANKIINTIISNF